MKATSIGATNFLAFTELDLELPEKIAVFVARNGTGKSSVLDTIKTTLLGTTRGVPRNEATALRTWGASQSWETDVQFVHDGNEGNLRRTATKLYAVAEDRSRTVLPQGTIDSVFGSPRLLEAIFDVWGALEMKAEERKRLIYDLTDVTVTEEKLVELGLEGDDVIRAALAGNWKRAEAAAAETKRAAKRALAEPAAEDPGDPMIGPLRAKEITHDLYTDSRTALKAIGDEVRRIDERIGAASVRAAEITTAKVTVARSASKEDLEEAISALEKSIEEKDEYLVEIRAGIRKLQEEKKELLS